MPRIYSDCLGVSFRNVETMFSSSFFVFFIDSSKKAEGMIKDMELKVSKLKSEREVVLEKIKMLEEASEA